MEVVFTTNASTCREDPEGAKATPAAVESFAVRKIIASFLVAAALPAAATTLRRLPLLETGRLAQVVVRGRVVSASPALAGKRVYTDSVVEVDECMKGPCDANYIVRQVGGEVAGRGTMVAGSAALRDGDETVLFLRARRDGTWAPVGMAQGVLRVERDARTRAVKRMWRDLRGLDLVDDGATRAGDVELATMEDVARAAR
jgi:hypothetical protein